MFKIEGEFALKNVEFSSTDYTAEIETVEPGKRYRIKVAFLPTSKKKTYQDEMIINTTDPQEPSLRVILLAHGQ